MSRYPNLGRRHVLSAVPRLLLVLAVVAALVVADIGVAEAKKIPETLADMRAAQVGVVEVDFPIDFVAISWHGADDQIDAHGHANGDPESHGAVRFRNDGGWGEWIPFREDGAQAEGQWSSSLVHAGDAEAYQVRGVPAWAGSPEAIAINTTDGPLTTLDSRPRGAVESLSNCLSRAEWGANESYRFVGDVETWPTTFYPVQGLIVHHTVTLNDDPAPDATVRAIYYQHAVGNGWGDIGYNYLIDEAGSVYEGRWSGTESVRCDAGGDGSDFAHNEAGEFVTGGHTAYHNQGNVGIALLGNFASPAEYPEDPDWVQVDPKPAAVAGLNDLLLELVKQHGVDPTGMIDYANPMCDLPSEEWDWDCDDLSLPYYPGRGDPDRFRDAISGHHDWKNTACPGASLYTRLAGLRTDINVVVVANRPLITVEQNPLTVEGDSTGGYGGPLSGVSASDPNDDPLTLISDAPTLLPLGNTVVTWTASDPGGWYDNAPQSVSVVDTQAPEPIVPAETVEGSGNGNGAVVTFTASASDVVDPEPTMTCIPASGSLFPLGNTLVTCTTEDASGNQATALFSVTVGGSSDVHTVGLVEPASGRWHLYDAAGLESVSFFYGDPGDFPFMGDWDGDGVETPGLYRQSDGYVYLRNSNTQGIADIKFFFGNPGDVPVAGDFDNDGFDTVSIYRPSNQTFYIINKLGSNDGGLGGAEFFYVFGNPGDKPFVGDFDGDGVETVGLHRESSGLVYFRNTHTQGIADAQFIYGDPGDRFVAGDWNGDGVFSPALFRPSNTTMYFRYTNTQGNADARFVVGQSAWIPVAGAMD